jgi:transcription initiation factor IIE alpha subunit
MNIDHSKMAKMYTCPMHHDYVSNKPGNCPKCGMTLVKKINTQQKGIHHKRE